jgi:hypothetical protein
MVSTGATATPLSVCLQLTQAISRATHLDEIYEAALDALAVGLNVQRASASSCSIRMGLSVQSLAQPVRHVSPRRLKGTAHGRITRGMPSQSSYPM